MVLDRSILRSSSSSELLLLEAVGSGRSCPDSSVEDWKEAGRVVSGGADQDKHTQ